MLFKINTKYNLHKHQFVPGKIDFIKRQKSTLLHVVPNKVNSKVIVLILLSRPFELLNAIRSLKSNCTLKAICTDSI